MVISKMAAVTLKLAYLLNYLFQISREGVYHWVFWRHIYLYQRAHLQALVWQSPEAQNPPELYSTEYGWVKDDQNKFLQPVTLPDEVELIPEMVLRLIQCECHSTTPCSSRACSCNSANKKCTIFCACYNQGCCNPTS